MCLLAIYMLFVFAGEWSGGYLPIRGGKCFSILIIILTILELICSIKSWVMSGVHRAEAYGQLWAMGSLAA